MTTFRSTPSVSTPMVQLPLVAFAVVGSLLFMGPDAAAQGKGARLSQDLADRLRAGDREATSIIVSGTASEVDAIAARHGLQIRKRLKAGALLEVPAGALAAVAADPR